MQGYGYFLEASASSYPVPNKPRQLNSARCLFIQKQEVWGARMIKKIFILT